MSRPTETRPIFAITNANKALVVSELDKLRREWEDRQNSTAIREASAGQGSILGLALLVAIVGLVGRRLAYLIRPTII